MMPRNREGEEKRREEGREARYLISIQKNSRKRSLALPTDMKKAIMCNATASHIRKLMLVPITLEVMK